MIGTNRNGGGKRSSKKEDIKGSRKVNMGVKEYAFENLSDCIEDRRRI